MTRISRTDFKLQEAKFFFLHLERDWRHIPNFEFFLSAFVSAARSVTWVMRYEYGKLVGWEDWFSLRQPPAHLRESLRKMNDIRVRATKTEPIRTTTTLRLVIPPENMTPELKAIDTLGRSNFRIEPTDHTNTSVDIYYDDRHVGKGRIEHVKHELPEFKGEDAIQVCKAYLDELETLVQECEQKFSLLPVAKTTDELKV